MQMPGMQMPGVPGEPKDPRIFQSKRAVPLATAFDALGIDEEWLPPFKKDGTHYKAIRMQAADATPDAPRSLLILCSSFCVCGAGFKWRAAVLRFHPDRQPANLPDEVQEKNTAEYMKAMAAFESIDAYYTANFATATGKGGRPVDISDTTDAPMAPKVQPAPPEAGKDTVNRNAAVATARAARPLLLKRRVVVHGLLAKPEYNGRIGTATQFDRKVQRYAVELDARPSPGAFTKGEKLKVKEGNLKVVVEDVTRDMEEP